MPTVLSSITRYAVETGRFRPARPSYTCPLCGSDGCIDVFPQQPVVIEDSIYVSLHTTCMASAGKMVRLVIPMTGYDAPFIEVRSE